MGFPINFPWHGKIAAKFTLCAFWLFFYSIVISTCSKIYWFLKRKSTEKTNKVNSFFKKRKTNSRHAGIQSKIYQKKKIEWIQFHQNKKFKCILGKSISSYTNLVLFLIIGSKNYISDPKILTKSAATVVFVRKVAQGFSFKKDSQFNSHFCICMWCCGCAASQTFHSYSSNCHYSQR